jgi:nitrogen fixation/metabolism regulation signal transduction histidine kinase
MHLNQCNPSGLDIWVYEQTHLGIVVVGSDLSIRFVNRWFEEKLNLNIADICGQNLYSVFPSLQKNSARQAIESALNGQVSVLSNRFHKYIIPVPLAISEYPGIELMQQSVTVSPHITGEEQQGIIITIENVTDRVAREMELSQHISELKVTEKSLLKSEEQLRESSVFNELLLQSIPFGMDIIDENGNILFLNHKLQSMLPENPVGKKCWEIYRDNKQQCDHCPLKKGISVGEIVVCESEFVFGGKTFEITHSGVVPGEKSTARNFYRHYRTQTGRRKNPAKC